jgi:hypothetical protein
VIVVFEKNREEKRRGMFQDLLSCNCYEKRGRGGLSVELLYIGISLNVSSRVEVLN